MRPFRQPADPYAVIGVRLGATRAEIRGAYRRRALEIHPDVAGRDSTAEMAALNHARDWLLEHTPGARSSAHNGSDMTDRPDSRPPEEPAFSHAPTWDDYWAAWNDPPRRSGR
jgi:hypothetical protein